MAITFNDIIKKLHDNDITITIENTGFNDEMLIKLVKGYKRYGTRFIVSELDMMDITICDAIDLAIDKFLEGSKIIFDPLSFEAFQKRKKKGED